MKFFEIKYNVDRKITGNVETQIEGVVKPFNIPNEHYYGLHHGTPFQHKVKLPEFKLAKRAKWTDYIHSYFLGMTFMFISKSSSDLFSRFKLSSINLTPVSFHRKNEVRSYFGLHFNDSQNDSFINWDFTSFSIVDQKDYGQTVNGKKIFDVIDVANFKDQDEYIAKSRSREKGIKLRPRTFAINENFFLDFFFVGGPFYGIYCSETLKNEMVNQGLIGFEFNEIKDFDWSDGKPI